MHAEAVRCRVDAGEVDVAEFSRLRSNLFDPATPNKYSRVIISEYSDIITTLPADDMPLPALNFNADPRQMPPMVRQQMMELARLQAAQAAQVYPCVLLQHFIVVVYYSLLSILLFSIIHVFLVFFLFFFKHSLIRI